MAKASHNRRSRTIRTLVGASRGRGRAPHSLAEASHDILLAPAVELSGRRDGQPPMIEHSDPLKARALATYRRLGTVGSTCIAAGIGRRTWYDWIAEDRTFAALLNDTKEDVIDELERAAFQRATAKNGSDRLLMFLLKALRPGKYRDALKIDMVSPIVKEKLAQTVAIIRDELTKELADPLLKRLEEVWQ